MNKDIFLKTQLVATIANIDANTKPLWGKMNLQQMVEHMSRDAFKVASGKTSFPLMSPLEHIPKLQDFIRSDKPFRENTVNRLMAADPLPLVHTKMDAALIELQGEIDYFFNVYDKQPELKVLNPIFGDLDFELQIQLLHKHSVHHLRQFGVELQ